MTVPPRRTPVDVPSRVLLPLLLALQAGCRVGTFACEGADACVDGGAVGTCQPDGWCSFDDATCGSGQRYGEHAPAALAGTCVDAGGSTHVELGEGSSSVASSLATLGTSDSTSDGGSSSTSSGTAGGVCGDGSLDPGEACDPGFDGFGSCTPACQPNVCGDGWVGPDEACDGGDACDAACSLRCGNGVLDLGEACDVSAADPGGFDCHTLGFESGVATCRACELDTSACVPCSSLGCTCVNGEICARGRSCVVSPFTDVGRCLLDCEMGEDCEDEAQCVASHCAIPCMPLSDACPRGSVCTSVVPNYICL